MGVVGGVVAENCSKSFLLPYKKKRAHANYVKGFLKETASHQVLCVLSFFRKWFESVFLYTVF